MRKENPFREEILRYILRSIVQILNIEYFYIVIEIFLKERKKIKKEKNRRRPFIVLSENSQRNSCHASRALEGNGSDARRSRASTAKRKRGKEKKKEKSTEERLIFPKIEFPPTR